MADDAGEKFRKALGLWTEGRLDESALLKFPKTQAADSGDLFVYRGVPSRSLNIGEPFSAADDVRFQELLAHPEQTPQMKAEGQQLWERKRTAGGQFFSDTPEVARHYAKDTGSVHAIKLSPEEVVKWTKGAQTTPGGVSSNFQIPNEVLKERQLQGQLFSSNVPSRSIDQELTESLRKPRVSDVPEDIAVTRRRIAEQVGGSVEQTYRKQEPTKNPFKNALRRIDRSKLEKEIPGMVREGQSYYFHTVRTGSPERASSITQSIDKNGLFYRHYGDSTNIRPFLLGPLGTEGQSRGKGPGGTTRGATSNPATYMERQSPSTRTYIIELPSDVSHIDDVGERITPNHPLYETVAEARETRSPGRSGDRPHIQVGPKGSKPNPSQQGYKMTANRQPWTGRLSADYIVGHVEDGQLTLKPQILEAVNVDQATKTPMGTVRGLLKGGLKVAATVFKVREAALFGIDISKHGPIEGTMESIGRFGGETGDLINVVGRGISAVVPETPEFYAKAGVSPPPSLAVARQLGSHLSSVGSVIGKLHDFGPQDDLDREEERERVRNIPSNPSNPSGD